MEASCKRIIKVLDKEIERMEKSLNEYVDDESEWSEKSELLISTPGVGNILWFTPCSPIFLRLEHSTTKRLVP